MASDAISSWRLMSLFWLIFSGSGLEIRQEA